MYKEDIFANEDYGKIISHYEWKKIKFQIWTSSEYW